MYMYVFTCILVHHRDSLSLLFVDEALARQLQEEEESKVKEKRRKKKHQKFRHLTEPTSLASMAADNYRAHHNSSPPQFGQGGSSSGSPQSGGGLVDIMGEQMAQQLQENELVRTCNVISKHLSIYYGGRKYY